MKYFLPPHAFRSRFPPGDPISPASLVWTAALGMLLPPRVAGDPPLT